MAPRATTGRGARVLTRVGTLLGVLAVTLTTVSVAPVPPASAAGSRVVIGNGWLLVHGADQVELTAATDLAGFLDREHGVAARTVQVGGAKDATISAELTSTLRRGTAPAGVPGIVLAGTPADNPLLRQVATGPRASALQAGGNPESYRITDLSVGPLKIVAVVGASAKGVMNGLFRLEDHNKLDLTGINETGTPVFANRVGGHLFTQSPPPDWSAEDQGAYYAHNYLNVVWGEKYGAPLPADVRARWGLKLAKEVKLPPAANDWLTDPAHASAVYRRTVAGGSHLVVDPFDPIGRQAFVDAFTGALNADGDVAILYAIFGDYSYAIDATSTRVSDGVPCACTLESAALEVMRILKQVIAGRAIQPAAWMWHLYPSGGDEAFMRQLKSLGVGMIYNEGGNGDDWFSTRNNFTPTAVRADPATGTTAYGPNYSVLVSAGGDCESADPAIGLPLPAVAASKLRTLADLGVQTFFLWWGGAEGWTY